MFCDFFPILITVNLPVWRRAVNCLCGVQTQKAEVQNVPKAIIDPQEEAILASEFIKEDPKWYKYVFGSILCISHLCNLIILYILVIISRFVNTNAIIVMSVSAFMWAWYA